jgi:3',5'-cyclic AMP phosphodiesterase CpdA
MSKVWIVAYTHKHGDDVWTHATREGALATAKTTIESWLEGDDAKESYERLEAAVLSMNRGGTEVEAGEYLSVREEELLP